MHTRKHAYTHTHTHAHTCLSQALRADIAHTCRTAARARHPRHHLMCASILARLSAQCVLPNGDHRRRAVRKELASEHCRNMPTHRLAAVRWHNHSANAYSETMDWLSLAAPHLFLEHMSQILHHILKVNDTGQHLRRTGQRKLETRRLD